MIVPIGTCKLVKVTFILCVWGAVDGLVSISSGVVTAISANKDEANVIGQSAAYAITGIYYNVSSVMNRTEQNITLLWDSYTGLRPPHATAYETIVQDTVSKDVKK